MGSVKRSGAPPRASVVRGDTLRYMPSKPYSLRLDPTTIRRLSEEAGRLRVPARTLAQDLVEEGLRMRRHPGVVFVDRPAGRRTGLARRPRLTVANVIETVRASADLDEAADYLDLSRTELEAALGYYAEFREEVDAEIEREQEYVDREHRLWLEREGLVKR